MLEIFTSEIKKALSTLNLKNIYEIRLRVNKPIAINVLGKLNFLSYKGLTTKLQEAIVVTKSEMNTIFYSICQHSVYSVNDELKQGYVTIKGGIRVGVAGQLVYENNEVLTIKGVSSLNIRIPHEVVGFAEMAFNYCLTNSFENTLIISPPGSGKTTLLRDLARQISKHNIAYNLMIIDERNEITNTIDSVASFDTGYFTDVLTNCSKMYGFQAGIRTLRPDIIFTDEIGGIDDIEAIEKAATCGIKIAATIHAASINDLKNKKELSSILNSKLFKRYILLSNRKGVGTYEGIFDENFKLLYREI